MRPPGEGLAVAYSQKAKWKETHWERPDYDALLLKANTTVDPAARNKLYQQAGEMLATQGGLILPMFVHQVLAMRANCEGYVPRAQNFNLNFETMRLALAAQGLSAAEIEDLMPHDGDVAVPPLPEIAGLYPLRRPTVAQKKDAAGLEDVGGENERHQGEGGASGRGSHLGEQSTK